MLQPSLIIRLPVAGSSLLSHLSFLFFVLFMLLCLVSASQQFLIDTYPCKENKLVQIAQVVVQRKLYCCMSGVRSRFQSLEEEIFFFPLILLLL